MTTSFDNLFNQISEIDNNLNLGFDYSDLNDVKETIDDLINRVIFLEKLITTKYKDNPLVWPIMSQICNFYVY